MLKFLLPLPLALTGLAGALTGTADPEPRAPRTPRMPSGEGEMETQLRKNDQENLGKLIRDYFEAKRKEKKVAEAMEDLRDRVEKIAKKEKRDPLSFVADWSQAFYKARKPSNKGPKAGKVVKLSLASTYYEDESGDPFEIEYALRAPEGYKLSAGPYPLILAIPGQKDGANEVPDQHIIEHWQEPDLLGGVILASITMPPELAAWSGAGHKNQVGGVGLVLSVFKDILDRCAVDYDRVFLAGRGPGVEAALNIGSQFPHRFAGIIGRAGDTGAAGEGNWRNFRNLSTLLTGAGAGGTAFEGKVVEAGYNNCHNQPDGSEADIWTWVQGTTRSAYPANVSFVPGIPSPNKAYWVEIPAGQSDEGSFVDASIDSDSNSVSVQAEGVRTITLYFNDVLLDLGKPVKVIVNGEEHENVIPRRLDDMLKLVYISRCDPGLLYTAAMRYDVPTSTKE